MSQNPYLGERQGGKRPCSIDPERATESLASLQDLKHAPHEGTSDVLLDIAIAQLTEVVDLYRRNKLEYAPGTSVTREGPAHGAAVTEERKNQETAGPQPQPRPELKDLRHPHGDITSIDISAMDFEALLHETPIGSASASIRGAMFKIGHPKIPGPAGFLEATTADGEFFPARTFSPTPSRPPAGSQAVCCEVPNLPEIFGRSGRVPPVALQSTVVATEPALELAPPPADAPENWMSRTRPATWKLWLASGGTPAAYTPGQIERLTPTAEEQAYWRQALRLPREWEARFEAAQKSGDPDQVYGTLVQWLTSRTDDGRARWMYVCHPEYGEFVRENKEHLPLIVSESHRGHCALLAWYSSAVLRAYGQPAWATTVMLPTASGREFNGSSLHMIVEGIGSNRRPFAFDPTELVEPDPTYHPSALSAATVKRVLAKPFSRATTDEERAEVVRTFGRDRDSRFEAAARKEGIQVDFTAMQGLGWGGIGASALMEESRLVPTELKRSGVMADWSIPRVVTPETAAQLFIALTRTCAEDAPYQTITAEILIHDEMLPLRETTVGRRQIQAVFQAMADLRLPTGESPMWMSAAHLEPGVMTPRELVGMLRSVSTTALVGNFFAALDPVRRSENAPFLGLPTATGFPKLDDVVDTVLAANREQECIFGGVSVSAVGMSVLPVKSGAFRFARHSDEFLERIRTARLLDEAVCPSGLVIEMNRHTRDETRQYLGELLATATEFRCACINSRYREQLCARWGIDESRFRELAMVESGVDWSKRRDLREVRTDGALAERENVLRYIDGMYLDGRDAGNFQAAVRRTLAQMGIQGDPGRATELSGMRHYVPGDDTRRLDKRQYARDKLYVHVEPEPSRDMNERLHVFINVPHASEIRANLQCEQILHAMIGRAKRGQEVVLGAHGYPDSEPHWIRVPAQGVTPRELLASLTLGEGHVDIGRGRISPAPLDRTGRPPRNLLVIGDDPMSLASMHYLLDRQCNLGVLYLSQYSNQVWPLVSDSWVRHGLAGAPRDQD